MGILDSLYPVQFANEVGLYALLSIIPLIIIYFLRPRPVKLLIPSLMFLLEIEKKKRRFNVFRKFIKDPLFLIQLLVLILLAFALAAPFIMAEEEVGGGHTVIILDASASMQADGKFNKAIDEATKFVSSKNTIILAESVPIMVMKEAPAGAAEDGLGKLKAKATSADLSSAIILGRQNLPEGGRMVVLSDFSSFSGDDPKVAKKLAEANGINVDFVTISGRTDNIGIVNGWFEPNGDYKIVVKNFNKDSQEVKIDVTTGNKNVLSSTLSLNKGSSEFFVINDLEPGSTKISLDVNDALDVDNSAHAVIPRSIEREILFMTDNEKSTSFLALDLNPFIKIEKTGTGGISSFSDYSIVFVGSPLSPGVAANLSDYIREGGHAVIIASPGMDDMEFLPVNRGNLSNRTSLNVITPGRMTEDINFEKIEVKKHFKSSSKEGSFTVIEGGDESVMLGYWRFGKGLVIYSGLANPAGENIYDPLNKNIWNDFHALPEYPLFWRQVLEWISGSLDVSEYNAKTGKFIKLPATQIIKTPGDTITTDLLLLDEVGVYKLPDRDIAVNLFDEKESNLEGKIETGETPTDAEKEIPYNVQTILKPRHFDIYLIIGGMFLVFLELYYLRWRGEL